MGNLFYDEPRVERKPWPFKARPYSEVGREPRVGDRVIVVDEYLHHFYKPAVRTPAGEPTVGLVGDVNSNGRNHEVKFATSWQSGHTEMFALVEEGVSA